MTKLLAVLGRVVTAFNAIGSFAAVGMLLLVGVAMLTISSNGIQRDALVLEIERDDLVTVTYDIDGVAYTSTFHTRHIGDPRVGDIVKIQTLPNSPETVFDVAPWKSYGAAVLVGAIALGATTYAAVDLVMKRNNVASFAGLFALLQTVVTS